MVFEDEHVFPKAGLNQGQAQALFCQENVTDLALGQAPALQPEGPSTIGNSSMTDVGPSVF